MQQRYDKIVLITQCQEITMQSYNLIEANETGKRMLYFLVIGIIPLLMIFIFHVTSPESLVLNAIANSTSNLPVIFSAKSLLLSKVMAAYTKTAPLLAIIFFLSSFRMMDIRKDRTTIVLVKSLILYYILYFIFIYVSLFRNHEITTSGRLLRFISQNDYLLTLFYGTLYSGIYIFTVLLFWFSIGVYKALKERM